MPWFWFSWFKKPSEYEYFNKKLKKMKRDICLLYSPSKQHKLYNEFNNIILEIKQSKLSPANERDLSLHILQLKDRFKLLGFGKVEENFTPLSQNSPESSTPVRGDQRELLQSAESKQRQSRSRNAVINYVNETRRSSKPKLRKDVPGPHSYKCYSHCQEVPKNRRDSGEHNQHSISRHNQGFSEEWTNGEVPMEVTDECSYNESSSKAQYSTGSYNQQNCFSDKQFTNEKKGTPGLPQQTSLYKTKAVQLFLPQNPYLQSGYTVTRPENLGQILTDSGEARKYENGKTTYSQVSNLARTGQSPNEKGNEFASFSHSYEYKTKPRLSHPVRGRGRVFLDRDNKSSSSRKSLDNIKRDSIEDFQNKDFSRKNYRWVPKPGPSQPINIKLSPASDYQNIPLNYQNQKNTTEDTAKQNFQELEKLQNYRRDLTPSPSQPINKKLPLASGYQNVPLNYHRNTTEDTAKQNIQEFEKLQNYRRDLTPSPSHPINKKLPLASDDQNVPLNYQRNTEDIAKQNIQEFEKLQNHRRELTPSPYQAINSNNYPPAGGYTLDHQDTVKQDSLEVAEEAREEPPLEILDVHQFFCDDYDINSLSQIESKAEKLETILTWAQTFQTKVTHFQESRDSIEYFVLDEKLMRLIEAIDKIKCQEEPEITRRKIQIIAYINKLHTILDSKATE